jgi:hypothetical protein
MTFEEKVSQLNAAYFFQEFTFSRNKFKPDPNTELELADAVVSLDDFRIIYQVKERNAPADTTAEREGKWFKSEILTHATKQIRDTLEYLKEYPNIEVCNDRGHAFNLAEPAPGRLHKIIVYQPNALLAREWKGKKYYESITAGIIHLLHAADYLGILRTFVTPVEVAEYLAYREQLARDWGSLLETVPEQALVGHYLRNLPGLKPTWEFVKFLAELEKQDQDEWDISKIITLFPDRRTTPQKGPTEYYAIIKELARMYRTDMRAFKERFALSMKKALGETIADPYRFVASTDCGFIFIPLQRKDMEKRGELLPAFTHLHKYDMKLDRCIGLSFIAEEGTGFCDVQWCRMEFPWHEDERTLRFIREHSPLRPLKRHRVERYGLEKVLD